MVTEITKRGQRRERGFLKKKKLSLVLIRWCKFFRWTLGLRGNIRFYRTRREVVCFVPCLLAAKTTWMWEAVLWSARAVVGQATVSRVIPTTLDCCSLPLSFFLFSPPFPSFFFLLSFPFFFLFFFPPPPHEASVTRGWMLSSSLCQNSLTGLGVSMLLISLANTFPLLARISPGISKEAVNYVGYSFNCSSLQCLKKKNNQQPNPKNNFVLMLCSNFHQRISKQPGKR